MPVVPIIVQTVIGSALYFAFGYALRRLNPVKKFSFGLELLNGLLWLMPTACLAAWMLLVAPALHFDKGTLFWLTFIIVPLAACVSFYVGLGLPLTRKLLREQRRREASFSQKRTRR